MNSSPTPSASVVHHPLLWISAGVLTAHALVLQAMPLGAHHSRAAVPLVFQTRTIAPPTPAPAPEPEPAHVLPATTEQTVAPRLKLGPAKRAIQQPHASAATTAAMAEPVSTPDNTQVFSTRLSAEQPAPSTETPTNLATAENQEVAQTEAEAETVAALSGQDILLAAADGTTPPRQRSSKASGPAPVHIPPPQRLEFDVVGQAKKFQYRASAELLWQHDGQHYQARQEIKVLFLGSRTQSSQGNITAQGLQPLQFIDRSRREQTAQFDHGAGMVRFNHPDTPAEPLLPGMQDRLSVFIQLGALLAAAPERYPQGSQIQMATVGGRSADRWTFRIEGPETLNLPDGPLSTLKLQRLPRDAQDEEQQAQLWLAPSLAYLPARIRLTQNQGDFVDLQLHSHSPP